MEFKHTGFAISPGETNLLRAFRLGCALEPEVTRDGDESLLSWI